MKEMNIVQLIKICTVKFNVFTVQFRDKESLQTELSTSKSPKCPKVDIHRRCTF